MRLQSKVISFSVCLFLVLGVSILFLTKRVVHHILINEFAKLGVLKTQDLSLAAVLGFQSMDEKALSPVLFKGLDRTGGVYAAAVNLDGRRLIKFYQAEEVKDAQESLVRQFQASEGQEYRQITLGKRPLLDISLPVREIVRSKTEDEFLLAGGKVETRERLLGTFHIGLPLDDLLATEQSISSQVIRILLLSGGLAFAVSLLTTRGILKKIRLLVEGTERVSRNQYGVRIPAMSRDELGDLAHRFNLMSERLARRDELILSSAGDAIFGLDDSGINTFVNPAAARMLGFTVEELVGRSMHAMVHHKTAAGEPFPEAGCPISTTLKEGKSHFVKDDVMWRKDGTSISVEYTSTPLLENNQVTGAVVVVKDITERKAQAALLEYRASHDTLTDLPNRNLLTHELTIAIHRALRFRRIVGVLFLDLDNFKKVNDTLGHGFGDLLLQEVGARLAHFLREGDTVARLGGDEFVLVLADVAKMEDVLTVAQKVLDILSKPFVVNSQELFITTSIGISLCPSDGESAEILLKNADIAMYRAKAQGKNHYELFSAAMNAKVSERLALETDLHRALDKKEFLLHYQPQIDLRTGHIVGTEALSRWLRNGSSLTSPGDFIPLAEETGLIVPIGEWALRAAAQQSKIWEETGLPPLRLSINLSARQFQQKNLLEMILRVINENGLNPNILEFELTESILMHDENKAVKILNDLKEIGVSVSVDDFGTGYSSLSYLKRFPISKLKIDKSFVNNITTDSNDRIISQTIVQMAHNLNLKAVAEGVETVEQLNMLRSLQCDEAQGYFFSRPLPAPEFQKFILAEKKWQALFHSLALNEI